MAHNDDSPYDWPEMDLPGQWSQSDFLGGDPDDRSYAQRRRDREAAEDYDEINNQAALDEIDAYERDRAAGLIPVGHDGFGAPLYQHQIDPKGQK